MISETDKPLVFDKKECNDKNDMHLVAYYKFKLLKRLNDNIVKFLENVAIKDLSLDLLEQTEYYFDEMIHEYNEIKPLMQNLRRINYSQH